MFMWSFGALVHALYRVAYRLLWFVWTPWFPRVYSGRYEVIEGSVKAWVGYVGHTTVEGPRDQG